MDKQVLNKVDGAIGVLCDLSRERFTSMNTDRVIALADVIGKLLTAREALEGTNQREEGCELTTAPQDPPVRSTAVTQGERGKKTDPCNDAETQKILSMRLRMLQRHLWDVLETDPGNAEAIHELSSAMDSLIKKHHSFGHHNDDQRFF